MSTEKQFNKDELLKELTLKQVAKTAEHLESMHGLTSASADTLDKIVEKLEELPGKIKIPEPPNNEETHKLLKEIIEETKKPCEISIELNLI